MHGILGIFSEMTEYCMVHGSCGMVHTFFVVLLDFFMIPCQGEAVLGESRQDPSGSRQTVQGKQEQAGRQAGGQASKQASEQASKQASRRASEQAGKQASEQANGQASKQANMQASWQASS